MQIAQHYPLIAWFQLGTAKKTNKHHLMPHSNVAIRKAG
jgi:hypothetical protein